MTAEQNEVFLSELPFEKMTLGVYDPWKEMFLNNNDEYNRNFMIITEITNRRVYQKVIQDKLKYSGRVVSYIYCPSTKKSMIEFVEDWQVIQGVKAINHMYSGLQILSAKYLDGKMCAECHREAMYSKTCLNCLSEFYCSDQCRKEHLFNHMYTCPGLYSYFLQLMNIHQPVKEMDILYVSPLKEFIAKKKLVPPRPLKESEKHEYLRGATYEITRAKSARLGPIGSTDGCSPVSRVAYLSLLDAVQLLTVAALPDYQDLLNQQTVEIIHLDKPKQKNEIDSDIQTISICSTNSMQDLKQVRSRVNEQQYESNKLALTMDNLKVDDLVMVIYDSVGMRAAITKVHETPTSTDRRSLYTVRLIDFADSLTVDSTRLHFLSPLCVGLPVYCHAVALYGLGECYDAAAYSRALAAVVAGDDGAPYLAVRAVHGENERQAEEYVLYAANSRGSKVAGVSLNRALLQMRLCSYRFASI